MAVEIVGARGGVQAAWVEANVAGGGGGGAATGSTAWGGATVRDDVLAVAAGWRGRGLGGGAVRGLRTVGVVGAAGGVALLGAGLPHGVGPAVVGIEGGLKRGLVASVILWGRW